MARDWWRRLLAERPRPRWVRDAPNGWWLAVGTVCFGAFMGQLDASIVTLTYAPLRAEFGASLAGVQWVSLSYLLVLAAGLIPVGRFSDAHGRKAVYLWGFVVFTAASAACGLAPTLPALVAFRVVQGLGAAMLQANSVALVVSSAPAHRARAALGVQATAQALGLALGPTVGGVLVSTLGWRWVFGINVPVGAVAVLAGIYFLGRTRHRTSAQAWDVPGIALLAAAMTTTLLGLSAAAGRPATWWVPTVLLLGGAGLVAAFVVRERRAAAPLVSMELVSGRLRRALTGAFAGYLVLFGPLVLVPVLLTARGWSPSRTGLVLSALPAGFALAASSSERLLPDGWSDRRRAVGGAVVALGALTGLLLAPDSGAWLVAFLAVLGVGLGVFTPANNAVVMRSVPQRLAGTGGGLLNMARTMGTALGVALVTLALEVGVDGGWFTGARAAVLVLAAAAAVMVGSAARGAVPPDEGSTRAPGR